LAKTGNSMTAREKRDQRLMKRLILLPSNCREENAIWNEGEKGGRIDFDHRCIEKTV